MTELARATLINMHPLMAGISLFFALSAAALLVWYLASRPALTGHVKLLLLLGFGVFPIGSAMSANIAGFEETTHRPFCGSCHVMVPYANDSSDPASTSLAARHARNEAFGENNCYECHRDYGAFSTLMTKVGGMRHVWEYYTHYRNIPLDQALPTIHLYEPFANAACMRCHSTKVPGFRGVPDHHGLEQRLRSGEVSCASRGCHGPAHPFSKPEARPAPEAEP